MKHILFMAFAAIFMYALSSCSTTSDVSYVEARNYFHKNNAPMPANLKIVSQSEFNSQFGMATTMGPDGKPTPIDFSKQFVIAKVLPVTDVDTQMQPVSLKKQDGKLNFTYRINKGDNLGFSIQPVMIIIVDGKYRNLDVTETVTQ